MVVAMATEPPLYRPCQDVLFGTPYRQSTRLVDLVQLTGPPGDITPFTMVGGLDMMSHSMTTEQPEQRGDIMEWDPWTSIPITPL
jgi:hypothetical protein